MDKPLEKTCTRRRVEGRERREKGGERRVEEREEGREEEGRDAYYYVECKQWVQVGVGVGCRLPR